MKQPIRKARWRGIGNYRDEAEPLLEQDGDMAGVVRGRPRSLLMKCPDGCGDTLVINLDPRAGKAWRLDVRKDEVTLYPSVWREDGCRSHFILWRDRILWCGRFEEDNEEPAYDADLERIVYAQLDPVIYLGAYDIAMRVGEVSWEVSRALRYLAREGRAVEGRGPDGNRYRRARKR